MDASQPPAGHRILALDLGKRRIGLAVSDPLGITAQGLPTLQRTRVRDDLAQLADLARELEVGLFLMGNPLHMSGEESRQGEYTREFAARLEKETKIPVRYWDERMTSVQAERVLRESGISIEKRAKAVDQLAAVILLESYLDSLPAQPEFGIQRHMIKRIIAVLFLALLAGAGYLAWTIATPHSPGHQVFVDIPPGTPTAKVASMLSEARVIPNRWSFLAVRALQPTAKLQAGEYSFERPLSVWDVFRKIARGEIFYYELTIPEGSNMFDIAGAVEQLGFMKSDAFLRVAAEPSLIHDLAPEAPNLEGYLFPATYRVTRHMTAKQIAQQMTAQFRKVWKEIARDGANVHETTTLASLVEKETAAPRERPAIAAVYRNRLKLGMKLDCDPTTIYAALLQGRYRGTIYRSDLSNTHPYNTYQNAGLPPGPIASPGLESLKAALGPAPVSYIYFVAKPGGAGEHNFSSTLAQHSAAVQAYRRGAKK